MEVIFSEQWVRIKPILVASKELLQICFVIDHAVLARPQM